MPIQVRAVLDRHILMLNSDLKRLSLRCFTLPLFLLLCLSQGAYAQFFGFTKAIPLNDPNGAPMAGGNTTFADDSFFQPAGNDARSSKWAWRPYGDHGILSSLGPTTTTLPTATKELATTVSGLKPGVKYDVKVLFWGPDGDHWGVRAGLNYAGGSRSNPWFDSTIAGVIPASLLAWNSNMPALFSESGRTLFAAALGTTTANSSGQIKAFIHDLPAMDSSYRTWYQGVALAKIVSGGPAVVDAASAGTGFHAGVRGQALADPQIDWADYWVAVPNALDVARGSAIRGVSTGLAADRYDWRTRNGQPRPSTLQFLRYSRDYGAELFLGVNMRGLIEPDPAGGWLFYDTNTATLASLAVDWVRYVNHIVPTYRQGDTVSDPRDSAILGSINWTSSTPGDAFDRLLPQGEPAVPQIRYWEIGNEPTVGVTSFSVNNSFTMDATNYYGRYKAITQAMKAENPSIKVGPTLVNGTREEAHLSAILSDPSVPVDFITYHPYERMGVLTDPDRITLHLGSVYSRQWAFYDGIRKVVSMNGRNPDQIEYAATEVNVSYWDTNDKEPEVRMAHALGTVETVFTHARLGLIASHYWIWPTHRWDGTAYPSFKAYQMLRDRMGDTLLSTYASGDVRLYTTRDSKSGRVAVWALNFSNQTATNVNLQFANLQNPGRITLWRLQDKSGVTTLFSSNLSSDMAGGPTANVDWVSTDLGGADLSGFSLPLPAATISLLVIEPGVAQIVPEILEEGGVKRFAVRFRPVPYASEVRYRLLRSENLSTWEAVSEISASGTDWTTVTDALPASSQARFFKIQVLRN